MIVMMIAMTPSLNASSRPLCTRRLRVSAAVMRNVLFFLPWLAACVIPARIDHAFASDDYAIDVGDATWWLDTSADPSTPDAVYVAFSEAGDLCARLAAGTVADDQQLFL